jgi:hypothetical protein
MTTDDLTDRLLTRMRELLRREPRFATMSRGDLDVYLGDLERDIRREVDDVISAEVTAALTEAEADREFEEMMAKPKRGRKIVKQQETIP